MTGLPGLCQEKKTNISNVKLCLSLFVLLKKAIFLNYPKPVYMFAKNDILYSLPGSSDEQASPDPCFHCLLPSQNVFSGFENVSCKSLSH
jgi:hypothetical protein